MWKRLAAFCCLFVSPALAETPRVVATLQPLHSLAAMVMEGVGTPDLLVQGAVSEHGYTLKPSDSRKLAAADLVVLVDPSYESFAAKSLRSKSDAQKLVWAKLPGMVTLPPRKGGAWDEHDDDHGGHDHDHGKHATTAFDGHVWLDVDNAKILITALSARLSGMDPDHAAQYADNARTAHQRLDEVDQHIRQTIAPIKDRPFIVFHDAYHYFEQRYGLSAVGSITVDPDRPPSARRMAELRNKVQGSKAACVFSEPQFPSPLAARIADSAAIRQGILDPQGANLPTGATQYPTLLQNLARSLHECLS